MKQIKVILSTRGPLHLIKSAEYLSEKVDIRVIQGWIPRWWNRWLIPIVSKIVGRDLSKSFIKRTPTCLRERNISIGFPEMLEWFCKCFKISTPQKYNMLVSTLYGRMSIKYLQNAAIFHVRSGSGSGGAIETAQKRGMKVVVDHSIAHPAFMDKQLREEYVKNGTPFDLGMDNPFWAGIITECKKSDIVLVNSEFVKKTFVENGFSPDKIRVVYLGVRKDFWSLKQDYCLNDDKLKILFTGGFGFRKGAEYILRALCKLDDMGFNYEMTVVGDYRGAMALMETYKPKHIHLVSTVPQIELKKYLSANDVYLFPSLCEGCASSGMEAMAAGMPVIATRESGLPIEDGLEGVIVPSKDVDSIIKSLISLATDKLLRKKLGCNAASKIRENYTWEKYADNVIKVYKDLLNN